MTSKIEIPNNETPADQVNLTYDLEQLSEFASLVTAARDALSDEMVTRLSAAFSEGITLLDRLTRNEGLMHLLREIDRPENKCFLISLSDAFSKASREIASSPPAKGGLVGVCKLGCNAGTQEGLRLVSLIGKYLSKNMRDLHQRGSC